MRDMPIFAVLRRAATAAFALFAFTFASAATAAPAHEPVVTVLGDSITAGYGLPSSEALPVQLQDTLARLKEPAIVRNAGISGDTSAGGLARVDRSVRPDTTVCVVALGANDLLLGIPPRRTQANLNAIVRKLKARGISVVVAGGKAPFGLSGDYIRAFDSVFAKVAHANDVPLAPDLLAGVEENPALKQPDGLHPNAQGVKVIAARLAPVVAAALRTAERGQTFASR
jgi:acyl-CoA thioesterase-1